MFAITALLVGVFVIFTRLDHAASAPGRTARSARWGHPPPGPSRAGRSRHRRAAGLGGRPRGGRGGGRRAQGLLAALSIDIRAGGIARRRTVIIARWSASRHGGRRLVARPAGGKVPPIAAMQDAVATSTGYGSKQRVFVGAGVLVLGAAALFTGLLAHPSSPVLFAGAGAVLVPRRVTPGAPCRCRSAGCSARRCRACAGVTGTIARQNATRNPKRTAAAASALMICVGMVTFITIFASSTKAAANTVYSRSFTGDFIINSGAGGTGGVDPALARRVSQLPQVAQASGLRAGMAKIEGGVQQVLAVDPRTAFGIFDVQPLQGNQNDLGRDAIAVYKTVATDHHLKIGDRIPVLFAATGTRSMRVALIYGSTSRPGLPARHQRLPGQLHQPVRPAGVRQKDLASPPPPPWPPSRPSPGTTPASPSRTRHST